ncbi:CDP-diacylglycerol--serine O-phosphatidyltransferase [bacterium]|nr:CDP-diacylglycerol--serine O-phosphatidyltransferase [bacterium]
MKIKAPFIPGIFTMLNLVLGVASIGATADGLFLTGAWLLIFAIFCDGMDGKIARWTNSTSEFGNELDSLADLVSSGVAPGLLIFMLLRSNGFAIALIFMCIFVMAGAYRLARFNILQMGDRSIGYIGLPIPVAGFTAASFVLLLYQDIFTFVSIGWLFIIVPFISILMVSTVMYHWPRFEFGKSWLKSFLSLIKIALLISMMLLPHYVLFPIFCGYILNGLIIWLFKIKLKDVSLEFLFWPKVNR